MTIGSKLYSVSPMPLNLGTESVDGSGDTLLSVTVLNNQSPMLSSNVSFANGDSGYAFITSAESQECYIASAQAFNLPIES